MKIRALLTFTALVSSVLGAVAVYLVLSVPNDLRADALLKEARQHIADGQNDKAREALSRVIQQYPRTDAAAASTVALVSLAEKERDDLARAVAELRKENAQQAQILDRLQKNAATMQNAQAKSVAVQAPAPKPAAKKKTTTKNRPTSKRRRR